MKLRELLRHIDVSHVANLNIQRNGKVRRTLLGGKGSHATGMGNRITMLSNQKDNRYGEIEVEKWQSRMIADFKESW